MFSSVAMLLLLHAAPAGAECEQPLTLFELETVVSDAEQAMGRSAELFEAASTYGKNMLPCLDDVVAPHLAARLHRVLGLRAFVAGDQDQARSAFAASHRIEPSFAFPDTVFSASHPISRLYAEAAALPAETEPAQWQQGTVAWLDGARLEQRPITSATLLQQTTEWGAMLSTHYLWPGDIVQTVPAQLIAAMPRPEPPPAEPSSVLDLALPTEPLELSIHAPVQPAWLRPSLVAVAGATTLAAGISYLAAGVTASDYRNNDHSLDELDRLKARNNTLVYTAGGLGVVAVGAGVGVAFTWQ